MYLRTHELLGNPFVESIAGPAPGGRPDLGVSPDTLTEYESAFRGKAGEKFRKLVEWAAKLVDINPGLLAANLVAEERRGVYLTARKVDSYVIGTDDFFDKRRDIAKKVPAFSRIKWDQRSRTTDINEQHRTVVTVQFNSGRDALLASAVYLKHGDVVLRDAAKAVGSDFDKLPVEVRFTLIRRAFNAGHGRAREELAKTLGGTDILVRDPKIECTASNRTRTIGRRCATIRAAQAIHLSEKLFGVPAT